jgi:type IV secretory pathway VirB2 component (pilin)
MNRDKTILLIFLFVGMLTMFNVPLWISAILVVVVAAIFLIAPAILNILETSSLKSKLPATKSALGPIAWTIVILAVIVGLFAIFYPMGDEDFKLGKFKKGYGYTGDYIIRDEALEFNKTLLISNNVNREYKYYNLYVLQGEGTVDIIVGNYEFPSIPFSGNTKIAVGFNSMGLSYNREPRIHVNDKGIDYPVTVLNLDNPHNVKMLISCTSNMCTIDDIFLGN